ncbi:hypothetical protein BDP55DRAFT_684570 [Colletotrichum godetiae]|uniref:Uncharacterized protein n=1 Tax=Colletotrichum godetiae TaxID=1209918 RepID=A0AAJ0A737_9PEZI|nr:uncharacterized protein BDP55DRAFT_684570 [Colletotrichum godetiae]KAK1657744.1 hypothetical protein BDP55DRAFT_684570 [Colletotrichum godetiae]
MKSSSGKGSCSVCGHLNNVHVRRTCIAKGCKQQIKICGASYHYCLTLDGYDRHQNGDVVCRECPHHGRVSKTQDFSQSPVVDRDGDGNIVIVKEGIM